jgi:hypothetical protein
MLRVPAEEIASTLPTADRASGVGLVEACSTSMIAQVMVVRGLIERNHEKVKLTRDRRNVLAALVLAVSA